MWLGLQIRAEPMPRPKPSSMLALIEPALRIIWVVSICHAGLYQIYHSLSRLNRYLFSSQGVSFQRSALERLHGRSASPEANRRRASGYSFPRWSVGTRLLLSRYLYSLMYLLLPLFIRHCLHPGPFINASLRF